MKKESKSYRSYYLLHTRQSENTDKEYLKLAFAIHCNIQEYLVRAISHLKWMLNFDYTYYCHSIDFHQYQYGINNTRKGFEMIFWQEKPDDDRYVNYVVQFSKDGHAIGLRVYSL